MIYKKINVKEGQKVWFISDTHYGHKNICAGTTEWTLEDHGGHTSVRDFKTLDQMNDEIVNNINSKVKQDDILFHLGDWSFGGVANIMKFRNRIICSNIHLILGNHDEHISKGWDSRTNSLYLKEGKKIYEYGDVFQSVQTYLELTIVQPTVPNQKKVSNTYNLFHFPITVWNKAHKNRKHLYGHVHGSYTNTGRAIDVGIDATNKRGGGYNPISEADVLRYMNGREFTQLSHHNSKTN